MKIAVCGVWHVHAGDYTEKAKLSADVIGVYDENPERRRDFAEKHGLREFESFERLLGSDAEGVIVCSSTESHTAVITALSAAKKHIFTEKVLALTDSDCEKIADAVSKNEVNFVISLVQKYDGAMLTAKNIADSGELGKINYLRFRNCHSGSIANWLPAHFYSQKECGGGAMIDLGAHGMYITEWFLGLPVKASSVFTQSCDRQDVKEKNKDGVEDNAVTVMGFKDGAIAVNETGFVSQHYPRILEIGGTEGRLILCGSKLTKITSATEGKAVDVQLLDSMPSPLQQFISGNILPGCGIKEASALTHMMVMAYAGL